jgi:hypothetical protein
MPDYQMGCPATHEGLNHTCTCTGKPGHSGWHRCHCGIRWDETGKISVR